MEDSISLFHKLREASLCLLTMHFYLTIASQQQYSNYIMKYNDREVCTYNIRQSIINRIMEKVNCCSRFRYPSVRQSVSPSVQLIHVSTNRRLIFWQNETTVSIIFYRWTLLGKTTTKKYEYFGDALSF